MNERLNGGSRKASNEECRRIVDASASAKPITPEGICIIDYKLASALTRAVLSNEMFIRAVVAEGQNPIEVLSIGEDGVSELSPRGILDTAEEIAGDPNIRARIIKGARAFVPRDSSPDTTSLRQALAGLVDDEKEKQKKDAREASEQALSGSKRPDSPLDTTVAPEAKAELTFRDEALLTVAICEALKGDRVFEQQDSIHRGSFSRDLRDLNRLGALRTYMQNAFDPLRNKSAGKGDSNHIGRRLYKLDLGAIDGLSVEEQSVLREKYVIWLGATFGEDRVSRWERESIAGLASEN